MADVVAEIEAKIRGLSIKERTDLIRALIAGLDADPEDDGAEQAWLAEAE